MALWPHPADVPAGAQCFCMANSASCGRALLPGLGIEMYHDFPPSHHGSGPVDNYGKDAPKGMDRDTKFNKLDRYNFEHCYNWSVKNMGEPTDKPGRFYKTWSATGYQWRAYTDGSHETQASFPIIPEDNNWQPVEGSNEFYAFRAVHAYKPQIQAQFVPCYCHVEPCPNRHITMAHSGAMEECFTVHKISGPPVPTDSDNEE